MQVDKVVRWRVEDGYAPPGPYKVHKNCQLTFEGSTVTLLGPRFSTIVPKAVLLPNIRGNYRGADYHICLEVMVETNWRKRTARWERWYVTFAPIDFG